MGRNSRTNKTSGRTNFKSASQLGNKINEFEIVNVRKFKDKWNNHCCYFTLNLGCITIYSLLYLVDKDENGYISFPKEEHDGKYYSTGFIDSELADLIINELEINYL